MEGLFETLAKRICEFCMQNYVLPYLREHGVIQSYRAKVISVDSAAKTMKIQRPFDKPVTLPYGKGASGLAAGSECTVFVLGDSSNAVVVNDGRFAQ